MSTRNTFDAMLLAVVCGATISGCTPGGAPSAVVTPTDAPTVVKPEVTQSAPATDEASTAKTPSKNEIAAPSPKTTVEKTTVDKAPVAKTIAWEKTFERAQAAAVKARKPIMVDFYTDWCGACKIMDSEAYTNARVIGNMQRFVPVKVNAEQRKDLAMRYKIDSYPTILWLDADGKILNMSQGYGGIDMLTKDMALALQRFSTTV